MGLDTSSQLECLKESVLDIFAASATKKPVHFSGGGPGGSNQRHVQGTNYNACSQIKFIFGGSENDDASPTPPQI